ncbi:MAG: DUF3299 domain-containing protein [Deltaproteobacteria bacterium]|nr:DUF3299 domain-containing protein [Deltaproteobacteria bacterium]
MRPQHATAPKGHPAPILPFLLALPLALLGALGIPFQGGALALDKAGYEDKGWLIWDDLVDPSWDPEKIFKELGIDQMTDDDPRAEQVLAQFLERWNNAPINPKMNGKPVRIPGFVVPLDFSGAEMREFFLVPFFGACIHVPPPPPNQIIHVTSEKGLKGIEAMEIVWVYGKLLTERYESGEMGAAGYSIPADLVEIYREDG